MISDKRRLAIRKFFKDRKLPPGYEHLADLKTGYMSTDRVKELEKLIKKMKQEEEE